MTREYFMEKNSNNGKKEGYLQTYKSVESITPIFCSCGRLQEYTIQQDGKKTW